MVSFMFFLCREGPLDFCVSRMQSMSVSFICCFQSAFLSLGEQAFSKHVAGVSVSSLAKSLYGSGDSLNPRWTKLTWICGWYILE